MMIKVIHVVTLLLLMGTMVAAEEREATKPNTVTSNEITVGWILLFDGKTNFGWKIEGEAKVEDGVLVLGGGDQETVIVPTALFGEGLKLRLQFWTRSTATKLPEFFFEFGQPGDSFKRTFSLPRSTGDTVRFKWAEVVLDYDAEKKTHLSSLTSGDGKSTTHGKTTNVPRSSTSIGFKVPPKCELRLHSLKLRPTGLQPIFNSKDLTGWKEIPGRKSKFSVTENGEFSIKDGPGDIQTAGQWDDFILQLDIKTNGKHLNSGVFFRASPGQFWSGYESQIRNQWEGGDRMKPVDFGTGGIYGRQPARKVVPNDNEWFTKTIIAHANHIAVWVNGYQVSDFTDEQPKSDNTGKGIKLGKGPISLQGHDPTTNLSFRDIRIATLPIKPEK